LYCFVFVRRPTLYRLKLRLCVLCVTVLLATHVHSGDLSPKQIERLKTLSELGQEACEKEEYESCQRAFEQAQALFAWAPHEYYIAEALVGQGKLVEGSALWSKILRENDPDDCHPSVCQAVRKSRLRLNRVEAQIPRVTFALAQEYEGLRVVWNERPVRPEELQHGLLTNPGKYRLEVNAPGYEKFVRNYQLEVSGKQRLVIELQQTGKPRETAEPTSASWQVPTGVALTVAGAAAIAVGAVMWNDKQDKLADYKLQCSAEPCRKDDPEATQIEELTLFANTAFVGGAVLLLAGGGLVTWDLVRDTEPPGDPKASTSSWSLRASASAAGVGVFGAF
jgi:hypothetical protein